MITIELETDDIICFKAIAMEWVYNNYEKEDPDIVKNVIRRIRKLNAVCEVEKEQTEAALLAAEYMIDRFYEN